MGKKINLSLIFILVLGLGFAWRHNQSSESRVVYRSPDSTEVVNQNGGFVQFFNENDELVKEPIPFFVGAKISHSWLGKNLLLPIVKNRWVAGLFGAYKRSTLSKYGIESFCVKHQIDLNDFVPSKADKFESFNHFFTRQLSSIGAEKRKPEADVKKIASPADSKVFVLQDLQQRDHFWVKESDFSLSEFLNNASLAEEFDGGSLLIFRLAPPDYHRFHSPLDFKVVHQYPLSGDLESVNPYAYAKGQKPLIRNKRHVVVGEHEKIGKFLIVAVGAMVIGNIVVYNYPSFKKGEELGRFEYGGSTVVLLFKKDSIKPLKRFLSNSIKGFETKILTGQSFADLIW